MVREYQRCNGQEFTALCHAEPWPSDTHSLLQQSMCLIVSVVHEFRCLCQLLLDQQFGDDGVDEVVDFCQFSVSHHIGGRCDRQLLR